jgi:alkaline phosphatase D
VENNYAALIPEKPAEGGEPFRARRAAAYQAYYEHMPLRRRRVPSGADLRLYRRLRYGRLTQFTMLDTRQYRSDQACGDGIKPQCPDWGRADRTFLGAAQEAFLEGALARSKARWNVIGQQIPLTAIDFRDNADKPGAVPTLYQDGWAGYPAARQRFFDALKATRARNPVAITGDVHAAWACEVNQDPVNPASPPVLPEFIGTSISSGGDGAAQGPHTPAILARNPQVKLFDGRRGYVRCRASPRAFDVDYRVVPFVSRPGAPVQSVARFRVQPGSPSVRPR